jgi:hypothetical protein
VLGRSPGTLRSGVTAREVVKKGNDPPAGGTDDLLHLSMNVPCTPKDCRAREHHTCLDSNVPMALSRCSKVCSQKLPTGAGKQ